MSAWTGLRIPAALASILILILPMASAQPAFHFYVFGDRNCGPCHQLADTLANIYGGENVLFCDTANPVCKQSLELLYANLLPDYKNRITVPTVMVRMGDRVVAVTVGPLDPGYWYNFRSEIANLTESQVYVLNPDGEVVIGEVSPDFQGFLNDLASRVEGQAAGAPQPLPPSPGPGDHNFWSNILFTLFLAMAFVALMVMNMREERAQAGGRGDRGRG